MTSVEVQLNQVGIVLSIIATVLLSPQWFGPRRLRAAERRIEHRVRVLHVVLAKWNRRIRGRAMTALWIVGILFVIALVVIVVGVIGALRTAAQFDLFEILPGAMDIAGRVLVTVIFVTAVIVAVSSMVLAFERLLGLVVRGIRRLARSLADGDRLSTWMIGTGIVTFFTGGVIQLIATFL